MSSLFGQTLRGPSPKGSGFRLAAPAPLTPPRRLKFESYLRSQSFLGVAANPRKALGSNKVHVSLLNSTGRLFPGCFAPRRLFRVGLLANEVQALLDSALGVQPEIAIHIRGRCDVLVPQERFHFAVLVRKMGMQPKVAAVLTGRLAQRGSQVQIDAELVNVSDGTAIWGERYNRPMTDVFAIQ